ncbi:MAG: hypothetical protein V3S21_10370, partial [Xanthomonadales bacterium]
MRSLLSKILLSLVISVVIALLVVVLITRISLHRGMVHYIKQQEAGQLEKLVPELAELYRQQGDWGLLRGHPRRWNRLLRITRHQLPKTDEVLEGRRRPAFSAGAARLHPPGRLNLQRRLFLLDGQKAWVAGAVTSADENYHVEPVEVEGRVVGWVGVLPARVGLPWEAQRFLHEQARALIISLVIALVLV